MSFNVPKRAQRVALTYEGGTGYLASPEMELLLLVAGSLFSGDTFYEGDLSRRERFYELARALSQKDPRSCKHLCVRVRV